MIKYSTVSYTTPMFKANNTQKKSQQNQINKNENQQPKRKNNIISKLKTGALVSTAFLAGLGTSNYIQTDVKAKNNENAIQNIEIVQNTKTILTPQEGREELKKQPNMTIVVRDTIDHPSRKYIEESRYKVMKIALLNEKSIRDYNTGDTLKKREYSDYEHIPKKRIDQNNIDNTKEKHIVNGFDKQYFPNSVDDVVYYKDGSKDSTNTKAEEFKISYKHIDPNKDKKETPPKKQTKKELTDEEIFTNMFLEELMN